VAEPLAAAVDHFLEWQKNIEHPDAEDVLGHLRVIYAAARDESARVPIRVAHPVFHMARQNRPSAERIRLDTALAQLFANDAGQRMGPCLPRRAGGARGLGRPAGRAR
jgi:hypothetical protein